MIQFDLFQEVNQEEYLLKELAKVKQSSDNVRKSIFGKIAELENKLREMQKSKQ